MSITVECDLERFTDEDGAPAIGQRRVRVELIRLYRPIRVTLESPPRESIVELALVQVPGEEEIGPRKISTCRIMTPDWRAEMHE